MAKLYDKSTISYIQKCLNNGNIKIRSFESYDDILPANVISLGDIRITFVKSDLPKLKGGYISYAILGENVTNEYYKEWKSLPIRSHMMNDFKRLITDKDNNVPYKEFIYTDSNGNEMRALVRYLFEIDDMDADMPDCQEYYETYTDLLHQNQCFMLIKIVPNFKDTYLYYEKLKINGGKLLVDNEYANMTPIPENTDNNSTPLFD